MGNALARIFYELQSRDREGGGATGSTIAECRMCIVNWKFAKKLLRTREQMAKSEVLCSTSSVVVKDPKSQIQTPSRGVPERYVAGLDTRGCPGGLAYPRSQSRQGVNS